MEDLIQIARQDIDILAQFPETIQELGNLVNAKYGKTGADLRKHTCALAAVLAAASHSHSGFEHFLGRVY